MKFRWLPILLSSCLLLSGFGAFGESSDEWYDAMLRNAQLHLGNNRRLNRVIERAKNGEDITIAVIGGSITEGAGAKTYAECYAKRILDGFRAAYGVGDGLHIGLVNAGVGGTASTFGWMRYERDVTGRVKDADGLPDIVIIEYAVNDGGEPTRHGCYESMVRSVLAQPNEPAVILLFSVFETGYSLQNDFYPIGMKYDLTMVSMKNSAYPLVGKQWSKEAFFHDEYHPTSLGHKVYADCVLRAIADSSAQEESASPQPVDVTPVYNANYMNLQRIFRDDYDESIALNVGSFREDDTSSYRNLPVGRVCGENFYHLKNAGNEPLTFSCAFKNLLIAYKTSNSADFGTAEVYVDGVKTATLSAFSKTAWGQSEVRLVFSESEAKPHTVEIRMADGSEQKLFTVTCLAYTPE